MYHNLACGMGIGPCSASALQDAACDPALREREFPTLFLPYCKLQHFCALTVAADLQHSSEAAHGAERRFRDGKTYALG